MHYRAQGLPAKSRPRKGCKGFIEIIFGGRSIQYGSLGLTACGESSSPAYATSLPLFDEVSWATEDEVR